MPIRFNANSDLSQVMFNGTNCTEVFFNGTSVFQFARFPIATGGTITTDGDFKVHTFTGAGSFTVDQEGNAGGSNTYRLLLVGGGGQVGLSGPGIGGGGGAGGMVEVAAQALPLGSYDIEVGNGPNME